MAPRTRLIVRYSVAALLVIGATLAAVMAVSCIDVVPKRAITPSAMTETSVRIKMYYQLNKHLPRDLSVLPVRNNYANRIIDAWNRPLIYTVDADQAFTLSSLGQDGSPDGIGDNADIVRKYRIVEGEVQTVP